MHNNTSKTSFVEDEITQLSKRPFGESRPLGLSYRYPVTNTTQVFKGYITSGVNGLLDYTLADYVVCILLESALSSPNLLELPSGGFRANPLQTGPHPFVVPSNLIYLVASVDVTVIIGCQVDDSEVNAQYIVTALGGRLLNVNHHSQVENTADVQQVSLTANPVHPGFLIATHHDRDDLPSSEGQDRHPVSSLPGQDALVVHHSTMRAKGRLDLLVSLVGFDNLSDSPNGHLGRQAEAVADVVIDQLLQLELAGATFGIGDFGNVVAGSVESFHCLKKHLVLVECRLQFYFQCQVHILNYILNALDCQIERNPSQGSSLGLLCEAL